MKELFQKPIKGLLIDISGVLKDGKKPIPGSVEAFQKLKNSKLPFRLVTNETQHTIPDLVKNLHSLGFDVKEEYVFAPIPAVIKIIKHENLRPFTLLHPNALDSFCDVNKEDPNCVVIGDADYCFTYELLNKAFRILMQLEKPLLFSLGKGKYYKTESGLTLDVGAFTSALEYSTGVKATIVGKPDSSFFLAAINDIGIKPEEALMIGDDIASDVGGAQKAGIRGVLVRTGKYRPEDESHEVKPDGIFDNLSEIINSVLSNTQMPSSGADSCKAACA